MPEPEVNPEPEVSPEPDPRPAPAAKEPSAPLSESEPDPPAAQPESAPEPGPNLEPESIPDPSTNPVAQVLTRVASAAQAAGLHDFLLVGGNAIILHGVPHFTRDVDFLIPAADERRWRDFLEQAGFAFQHGTPGFSQFDALDPASPRVDLMLVDASTWEKLTAEAQSKELSPDLAIRLPVPHHLIAMKLRAARSATRAHPEQDWSDIAALVRLHGYSLEDPTFRELVVRFGGLESIAVLEGLLSRSAAPS